MKDFKAVLGENVCLVRVMRGYRGEKRFTVGTITKITPSGQFTVNTDPMDGEPLTIRFTPRGSQMGSTSDSGWSIVGEEEWILEREYETPRTLGRRADTAISRLDGLRKKIVEFSDRRQYMPAEERQATLKLLHDTFEAVRKYVSGGNATPPGHS